MNSQCDSTGRVGVCCVGVSTFPVPPGSWLMSSRVCGECSRRCYLVVAAEGDDDTPADACAVVDLLGLAL